MTAVERLLAARAAQGLGPTVTDERVLAGIAAVVGQSMSPRPTEGVLRREDAAA